MKNEEDEEEESLRKTIEGSDTIEFGSAAMDLVEGVKKKLNVAEPEDGSSET